MLTLNDLNQFHAAAIAYCNKVGLDPYDVVSTGQSMVVGVAPVRARWENVAEQMLHLGLMIISMNEANGAGIVMPRFQ